jgi:heme-degrading monooxygenase HmoA
MILEVAVLTITPLQTAQFEAAFTEARQVISGVAGLVSYQLHRCIETEARYLLLVQWLSVEHHTVGFRQSPQFQQWRALLGPFFAAAPAVEHYQAVSEGAGRSAGP